ncbi:MAG: diacylglycerol kinase [Gammaproteobacteria bacterium]|nr:MAG: diacylglycerol kinase [Gammaproteobacteria bacterium]
MASKQNTGFKRIYNAFFYSMAGLSSAWKNEAAFRQESLMAIVLIPIAFWLAQSTSQIGLLILSIFIVLIVELLNSAIEAAIDRISEEHHALSKQSKDIASAAVFLSLVLFATIWCLVIFERFYSS